MLPLLLIATIGCSGSPNKPDNPRISRLPPGTQAWSGDALQLPNASPIVMEVDLKQVMRGAKSFRDWLVAEPAMFGENGDDYVNYINLGWGFVQIYLGADPEKQSSWNQHGIDVGRPLLIGAYAASSESQDFTEAIETSLAKSLGLAPVSGPQGRAQLIDAARLALTNNLIPEGLHASVVRAMTGRTPATGMRILVPTVDPAKLTDFVEAIALAAKYERVSTQELKKLHLNGLSRVYIHDDGDLPAFNIRSSPTMALIDVVVPAFSANAVRGKDTDIQRPSLLQELDWAVTSVKPGRPVAPRAPRDSAVSLGFDQAGASQIARVRGYRSALEITRSIGAIKRDRAALEGFLRSLLNARAWDIRSHDAPALAYSIDVPQDEPTAIGFDMTIFTAQDTPLLEVPKAPGGLSLAQRGLGFSASLTPFNAPVWRKWLYIERSRDVLDALDAFDPFSDLAAPRNLVMLLGNLAHTDSSAFDEFAPVIKVISSLTRLEIAMKDTNIRNFSHKPRYMIYAPFVAGISPEQKRQAMFVVLNTNLGVVSVLSDPTAIYQEDTTVGPPNTWTSLDQDGVHIRYRYDDDSLFLTIGLTSEESEAEHKLAGQSKAQTPSAVFFRVVPLALLSATNIDISELFDPVVLTQRMGPIIGNANVGHDGPNQFLVFRIELRRPESIN